MELIIELTENLKIYILTFTKLGRSSDEEMGQKFGCIMGKSNFHRRDANERMS